MSKKIIKFITIHKNKSINLNVNQRNSGLHIFIIDVSDNSSNVSLKIEIEKSCQLNLFFYTLNNGFDKNIKIKLNHQNNSQSNVVMKVFAKNKAHTSIDLISQVTKNTKNVKTDQNIDGILLDNNSKIQVIPSMLIDTNIVKAFHAVNIGNINPEQLFYLMSRGINKKQATITLLNAMFTPILRVHKKQGQDIYNSIQQKLIGMIANDEKY